MTSPASIPLEFQIASHISELEKKLLGGPISMDELQSLEDNINEAMQTQPSPFLCEQHERYISLVGRNHSLTVEEEVHALSRRVHDFVKNHRTRKNDHNEAEAIHDRVVNLMECQALSKEQIAELIAADRELCLASHLDTSLYDTVLIEHTFTQKESDTAESAITIFDMSASLFDHKIGDFFKIYHKLNADVKELLIKHFSQRSADIAALNPPQFTPQYEDNLLKIIQACFRAAYHLVQGRDLGMYPSERKIEETFNIQDFD